MPKTALVVDDSKTARVVLQQMLETHDLEVVSAVSAEDALTYLSEARPDIIFMDHEMPGMDGLEAVSAIKNNPATATIPIMMYTAQQGEVYVGQARALGAVGVLPKQLEPVEVSKVLKSLRIIGQDAEQREVPGVASSREESGNYPSLDSFDSDLREMIQGLFDQQRGILRRELEYGQERIAARIADEMRSPKAEEDEPAPTKPAGPRFQPAQIAIALLAAIVVILAASLWLRQASWQQTRQENLDLLAALEAQRGLATRDAYEVGIDLGEAQQSRDVATNVAMESLEWAANQAAHYGANELPMGDYRLTVLQELSDRLLAVDFRGLVRIESHVGDFCMTLSVSDGLVLAPPDMLAAQCDPLGFEAEDAY